MNPKPTRQLLIGGRWTESPQVVEIRSPYRGEVVGSVHHGDAEAIEQAVAAARAALALGGFPQHERAAVLERTAALIDADAPALAETLTLESGKPLKTATVEVRRAAETLRFSAVEARKLTGQTIPMEASSAGVGKLGLTLRVPCGVVGAISPFNFPANLVVHKLGPAIAGGNAVILKPAEQTPLTALAIAHHFVEAGLPPGWLSVVNGEGATVGEALVAHPDVAAITFTGSAAVGWGIRAKAPAKKVNLELGSTAPVLVCDDADLGRAAAATAAGGFLYAGQTCVSAQRVLVHESVVDDFTERLGRAAESLIVGDPLDPATDVGPLITTADRDRVRSWTAAAVAEGRCLAPTVIRDPRPTDDVWCREVFGPVVSIRSFATLDEAIDMANDSRFGLQAGIFTADLANALHAARSLEFGGVLVNEAPNFRADQMPYGGVKDSGNTREGPAFAIQELTEERFVMLGPA